MFRIGFGYDAHRLVDGRPLILGGISIPFGKGLLGHSDADVLTHAVVDALLGALDETILAQDPSRTMALVDSYLERTGDRQQLLSTIVFSACRFQNDPHVQRHAITALEEYEHHTTGRRDEIIRAAAKYASRCIKRSLAMEAFDLYTRSFASD